jgi:hypothetical protein
VSGTGTQAVMHLRHTTPVCTVFSKAAAPYTLVIIHDLLLPLLSHTSNHILT